MTSQPSPPRRGDIYWVDFDPSRGSEQRGQRPAVVISIDSFNRIMPVVMVAAITTKIKPNFRVTVTLQAGEPLQPKCQILAFQVVTIDKSRLGRYEGCLDADQLHELEDKMRLVWGL